MTVQRRTPKQQRSRERVDAILSAANDIIRKDGLEALTVREVAARTEIPAATVYRYFSNRDEIAASFLDREMEQIDLVAAEAVLKLERVSLRSLFHSSMFAQLRYHQRNSEVVPVWFAEPRSPLVVERIKQMDLRTANWWSEAVVKAGMLPPGGPVHRRGMLARLGDRALEYVLTSGLSAAEQDETLEQYVDMTASFIERFATQRGVDGIPTSEFFMALDQHPTHMEI